MHKFQQNCRVEVGTRTHQIESNRIESNQTLSRLSTTPTQLSWAPASRPTTSLRRRLRGSRQPLAASRRGLLRWPPPCRRRWPPGRRDGERRAKRRRSRGELGEEEEKSEEKGRTPMSFIGFRVGCPLTGPARPPASSRSKERRGPIRTLCWCGRYKKFN